MIELFNNSLEDGDWWVARCKETKQIFYEGNALPSLNVWNNLVKGLIVDPSAKALTNEQLKELLNESDN